MIVPAGVFDGEGKLVGTANSPIQIWKDGKFVEQSSTDIWLAICTAVKSVCAKYRLNDYDICGIGFSATCSLGKFVLTRIAQRRWIVLQGACDIQLHGIAV